MPTASGRRSGAVYGEKLPKTRLARIYCFLKGLCHGFLAKYIFVSQEKRDK